MKNGKPYIIIFIITLIFSFLYLMLYKIDIDNNNKEYTKISVITRFTDTESFGIIMQGMEQAASDMKAEITYISLAEYNNADEQNELIIREFNNDADAIIISAADSNYITETINNVGIRIPIIAIESTVNTNSINGFYSANNYEMGKALGEKILSQMNSDDKNIVILQGSPKSTSISEREKGINDVFYEKGINIITVPIDDMNTTKPYFFDNLIFEYKPDIIIATETEVLEKTASYFYSIDGWNGKIYGAGTNGKIASYLEKEIISAIVVQNEFNIGYLGVQAAVLSVEGKSTKYANIDYKIIDRKNMYTKECQRLIFPFIR